MDGSATPRPDFSVVLPFRNARSVIVARIEAIFAALEGYHYELIAVDDGSTDGSMAALRARIDSGKWPGVRAVQLRRSFGQSAALAAGFDRALGASVVTIDVDGQTDPADIALLLGTLDTGADLVSGWRDIPRSLPARIGNQLIGAVTGVHLHDYGCPLKAYRADMLHELRLYGDMYRFAPALAFWQGARVSEVRVREHATQRVGRGAGLRRIVGILIDLFTVAFLMGYTGRPMQAIGRVGGALLMLAGVLATYLAYVKLIVGQDIGSRPLTLLAALAVVLGVQLLGIGLLAELAMRVYYETQNKPIYAVREELNQPAERAAD